MQALLDVEDVAAELTQLGSSLSLPSGPPTPWTLVNSSFRVVAASPISASLVLSVSSSPPVPNASASRNSVRAICFLFSFESASCSACFSVDFLFLASRREASRSWSWSFGSFLSSLSMRAWIAFSDPSFLSVASAMSFSRSLRVRSPLRIALRSCRRRVLGLLLQLLDQRAHLLDRLQRGGELVAELVQSLESTAETLGAAEPVEFGVALEDSLGDVAVVVLGGQRGSVRGVLLELRLLILERQQLLAELGARHPRQVEFLDLLLRFAQRLALIALAALGRAPGVEEVANDPAAGELLDDPAPAMYCW